jgi:hypothetical protein
MPKKQKTRAARALRVFWTWAEGKFRPGTPIKRA